MSSNVKTAAIAPAEVIRGGNAYRIAIVGASSLKGKEIAEVLHDRNFPCLDIKLLDDDEASGKLETMKDEITFIQRVRADQFEKVDFTFFASDAESTRASWKVARKAGSDVIDLSYGLEDMPGISVRSAWIERQLGRRFTPELQPAPIVVAHPAAVVLALIFLRIQKAGEVIHGAAVMLEPASEHGQKGMDELHEQTVNLLSFQQLPTAVFDTQVAFNLVSRYGARSVPALSTVRERVLKHFQQIVGEHAKPPSLMLLQAPVFHGYAFAINIEMREIVDLQKIGDALAGDHVTIVKPGDDAPSNVSVAGQGNILLSIAGDKKNSFWLWASADNLRIGAIAAVECAESMAAARPRGKIQ